MHHTVRVFNGARLLIKSMEASYWKLASNTKTIAKEGGGKLVVQHNYDQISCCCSWLSSSSSIWSSLPWLLFQRVKIFPKLNSKYNLFFHSCLLFAQLYTFYKSGKILGRKRRRCIKCCWPRGGRAWWCVLPTFQTLSASREYICSIF